MAVVVKTTAAELRAESPVCYLGWLKATLLLLLRLLIFLGGRGGADI